MNSFLDPLPFGRSGYITCHYTNETNRLQVIRITNVPGWYFERIIFPKERLIFFALPEALLEVHTSEMATAVLSDHIPCMQLRCAEPIGLPQVGEMIAA